MAKKLSDKKKLVAHQRMMGARKKQAFAKMNRFLEQEHKKLREAHPDLEPPSPMKIAPDDAHANWCDHYRFADAETAYEAFIEHVVRGGVASDPWTRDRQSMESRRSLPVMETGGGHERPAIALARAMRAPATFSRYRAHLLIGRPKGDV